MKPKKKSAKKKKTQTKIEQPKPICNIIESISDTIDPTQNCISTADSNQLDQASLMNTSMKEKSNTKEYTPLSKGIFKGMVLENESANPSGMLGCNSGNVF